MGNAKWMVKQLHLVLAYVYIWNIWNTNYFMNTNGNEPIWHFRWTPYGIYGPHVTLTSIAITSAGYSNEHSGVSAQTNSARAQN
jgi:hypothetical protein